MKAVGWLLSPFRTLLAILHTTVCSAIGLIAMSINATNGDWVMWRIGRQMWSRPLLQFVIGAKLRVEVHPEAQVLADRNQGVVLVANHSSLLDINAAFAASPSPIVFLSKASVRKVPLLGKLNEMAGTVFVERGNRDSSENAVNQLTATLKEGRSVLVFPEGTRSQDNAIQPFKKGAFHLAKSASAPIVPMHISGTWERLRSGNVLIAPSTQPISILVGAPIQQELEDSASTLLQRAERAIKTLSRAHAT